MNDKDQRRGDPVAYLLVNNQDTVKRHLLTKAVNIDLPDGTYMLYPELHPNYAPQPAEPCDPAKDAVEEDNRRAAEQACNVLALRLGYVWNGEDWIEHKPAEPVKVPSDEVLALVQRLVPPTPSQIASMAMDCGIEIGIKVSHESMEKFTKLIFARPYGTKDTE